MNLTEKLSSKKFTYYIFALFALYFTMILLYSVFSHPIMDFRVYAPLAMLGIFFVLNLSTVLLKHTYLSKANILFHTAFALIIVGVILKSLYGFSGEVRMVEDTMFTYKKPSDINLKKGFLVSDNLVLPSVSVKNIDTAYWGQRLFFTDLNGDFQFIGQSVEKHNVALGSSVKVDGVKFRIKDYGLYPKVTFFNKDGAVVSRGVLPARIFPQGMAVGTYTMEDYNMKISAYTEYDIKDGEPVNLGHRVLDNNDVLFDVTVTHRDGAVVFDGLVFPGQGITIDDLVLSFEGVKEWVNVNLSYDPGEYFVFAGFFIALMALLFRLREIINKGRIN